MDLSTSHDFQGAVYNPAYPGELEAVFHRSLSDKEVLDQLLPVLGYLIKCDYCLLYLCHPKQNYSKITHYWEKTDGSLTMIEDSWHIEDKKLRNSPLFRTALAADHSVFVEDVDSNYQNLQAVDPLLRGEKALAQGHIIKDSQLWGILRVGIFARSRSWMQFDRSMIIHSVQRLVPHVINYVTAELS